MDCMEFHKLTEDYENLSDENKNRMKAHIEACSECSEFFDEYNEMCEALKAMPRLTAPDDFLLNLNKRIDSENKAKSRFLNNIKKYSYRYGAAAACLTLITLVGINANDYIEKMNGADNGITESIDLFDASATALPTVSAKPVETKLPETIMPNAENKTEKSAEQSVKTTSAPTGNTSVKATAAPANKAKSTSKPQTTVIPQPNRATLSPTVAPRRTDNYDTDYIITAAEAEATAAPTEIISEHTEPVGETEVAKILNPNEYELPEETEEHSNNTDMYSQNINSIEVSYAKVDMVKEIMNEYSLSQDGELYNISADVFDELQQKMNSIGIEIENSLIDSESNTIMFKIVVS